MPQIINTNIASINAQRNLDKSQSANQQALQRLSSGLRINSAKDDAAGLAISTRFTSQIKGLNVAVRNAGDGIALAQTAEGALGSMNNNLQRIRELAVQSANATNSDVDREALQAEVEQLVAEITRTADETDFNGRKLLDGSFSATFQIGANAGQTLDVSIAQLTADKLGVGKANGVSAVGSNSGLQNGDLVINGVAIEPSKASSDTFSSAGNEASAISKVAAINAKSSQTGVSAVVNTNVALGSEMTAAATTGTVTVNGVEIEVSTGGQDAATDRDAVISAINAKAGQTGVTARDGGDGSGVILEAKDGRNIDVALGGTLTEASTGLATGTTYGGYTLISKNGSDIKVEGGQGTGTGDIRNSGLTVGTYSGREAAVTSKTTSAGVANTETASTFTTGNFNISGTRQINATNNTFEISVNGGDFQTLTLDAAFDADGAGALTAGQYNDSNTLAAQINNAIANDTNFQDADGNALVTATGNADGSITFTTAEKGADSGVVVRTGTGNMEIPTDVTTTSGAPADTLQQLTLDFKFDGNNAFTAATGNLVIDVDGTDITVAFNAATGAANGTAFTADEFAAVLNTDTGFTGANLQASVAEDGVSVVISSTAGSGIAALDVDNATTLQSTNMQNNYQQLANGDTVITDVDTFADAVIGANAAVNVSVDGANALPVDLGSSITTAYEAYTGVAGSYADDLAAAQAVSATQSADLATFLNNAFAVQTAGSGITATAVGDQVVLSSNSGGSVALSQATANAIGGTTVADIAATTGTETVAATSGTATTGNFNVDAEGNFLGAGSTTKSPLVIEAGKNDTFSIALDGGATQNVTIAAGSYSNMDALSAAINTALGGPTTTVVEATKAVILGGAASTTLADFDFSGTSATFDLELNGGAAQTITLSTDLQGATLEDTLENVRGALQTQINNAFGSGLIEVGIEDGKFKFSTVAAGASSSLEISAVTDATALGLSAPVGPATGSNAVSSTTASASVAVSSDKQGLVFTSALDGATSAVDITNGTFAIEGGAATGAIVTDFTKPNVLQTGDLLINGTSIQGASAKDDTASDTTALTSDAAGSGIAVAAAINKSTAQTGVTATVNATTVNGGEAVTDPALKADAGSTGKLIINNVETSGIALTGDAGRDRQAAIDAINAIAGRTGVSAADNGESITLTAADGRNISVAIDNQLATNAAAGRDSSNFGNAIGLSAAGTGIGEGDITGNDSLSYANTAGTTYSTVTLTSSKAIEISAGENGGDELDAAGLQAGTFGGGEDGTFLKDIDISTFEGAQAALVAVDNAIAQVASQRADLGAIQNRMESTVSNLKVTSENLSAANSRIQDADFAAETAELSRTQVLQQAGISILAQANASGQNVLSLLG